MSARLLNLKVLGDNINQVFKKKKVIPNSMFINDPISKTTIPSSPPAGRNIEVNPLLSALPVHFMSMHQAKSQKDKLDLKSDIEEILLRLLEEHKAQNNSETNMFNKLNFIEKAIHSIRKLYDRTPGFSINQTSPRSPPVEKMLATKIPPSAMPSDFRSYNNRNSLSMAPYSGKPTSPASDREAKSSGSIRNNSSEHPIRACRSIAHIEETLKNSSSLEASIPASNPPKRICLKKYQDIISEIDNMKLKLHKNPSR